MADAGLDPVVEFGTFLEESGVSVAERLVREGAHVDAVFAANDMMAIGCLAALNEAGLRVPEDIALAGFDDIPIARYVSPPLTTMHVPIADLGIDALDALADRLESHDTDATTTVMPVQLVVRRSCGGAKT